MVLTIALLAMFAQMERIYMLERAAGARAAKQARGLPTGRPAKLTRPPAPEPPSGSRTARSPNRSPPNLGISRSTLYRGTAQASRGRSRRTGRAGKLISGPERIPGRPVITATGFPGAQLASRARPRRVLISRRDRAIGLMRDPNSREC
jgi:hypothetical protein